MNNIKVWKEGELLAKNFLRKKGYKILHTNYKTNLGELDIVAKDKKTIVFVEVKAKSKEKFGRPCEMVNNYKKIKIMQVAQQYQRKFGLFDIPCRFDVIEVLDKEINHIINAW